MSDEELRDLFRELTKEPIQIKMAKVLSVDQNAPSCTVLPANEAALTDVRLKAGVDGLTDGVLEVPAKDSSVLIGIVNNNPDDAFVLKCSKVDKVLLFGQANGGLVVWPKLKKELDKHKQLLEAILQVIRSAPIPEAGNGAPSSFQQALNGALSTAETGVFSGLENEKVTHG